VALEVAWLIADPVEVLVVAVLADAVDDIAEVPDVETVPLGEPLSPATL
jgi:hypothetical protein